MSQPRGSSATRSGKSARRARSISAQIPQGAAADASAGGIGALRRNLHKLDARVLQQVGDGLELVGFLVVDRADTGVDENLEAMDAGGMGDVNVGVANR